MSPLLNRYLLFSLLLMGVVSSPQDLNIVSNPWKLKKSEDGVKVYTRRVEGSDILEFKAIAQVNTGLNQLVNKIHNAKGYRSWMKDVEKSELLNKSGKKSFYTYVESAIPWPFSNRDIVLLNTIVSTDSIVIIRLKSKPDFIPEKKGIVRIRKGYGYWKFIKVTPRKSLIEYCFYSDPEGNFPDWLVNKFIIDMPFCTLRNLKNLYN